MPTCVYCGVDQHSQANLKWHIKLSPRCHQVFIEQISEFNTSAVTTDSSNSDVASKSEPEDKAGQSVSWLHNNQDITVDELHGEHSHQPYVEDVVDKDFSDRLGTRGWNQGVDNTRFIKSYPDPAGVPIDTGNFLTYFSTK
jgi:hypothetical protein